MLIFLLIIGDLDVLDIAATEDNVVESLMRRWDELLGLATFGTVGINIFKSDGRLFWIDLMQCTDVAGSGSELLFFITGCFKSPNFTFRYEVEALAV